MVGWKKWVIGCFLFWWVRWGWRWFGWLSRVSLGCRCVEKGVWFCKGWEVRYLYIVGGSLEMMWGVRVVNVEVGGGGGGEVGGSVEYC